MAGVVLQQAGRQAQRLRVQQRRAVQRRLQTRLPREAVPRQRSVARAGGRDGGNEVTKACVTMFDTQRQQSVRLRQQCSTVRASKRASSAPCSDAVRHDATPEREGVSPTSICRVIAAHAYASSLRECRYRFQPRPRVHSTSARILTVEREE